MALPRIFDATVPPGLEVTSGPGPAPTSAALITRYCERCGTKAFSDGHTLSADGWVELWDHGRETGRYFCERCWPTDEAAA